MPRTDRQLEETKAIMRSLVRMKPKPHEDMKIGKKAKTARKRKVSKAEKQKPA